jgi:hypothetical protein
MPPLLLGEGLGEVWSEPPVPSRVVTEAVQKVILSPAVFVAGRRI